MSRITPQLAAKGLRLLLTEPRAFAHKLGRLLSPTRGQYDQSLRMTLREWLLYHQRNILFSKCVWMSVPTRKNPLDAWVIQEIVVDVKPDVVVEIGSAEGGSTLYLAHLLDILGRGTVVSVDIDRTLFQVSHQRIITITGDSSASETIEQVRRHCNGTVLVIQDGDHRKAAVLRDLRAYAPVVSVGSYFIIEDGIIDLFRPGDGIGTFDEGPLAAVEEFLAERTDFALDRERERYLLTYNPKGFLRRIR